MEEEVIIEIKLEQDEARKEAARLTAVLADQKKELADLRKAYRSGEKSAEEYGKEAFKLNNTIKDNSDALRQNTKEANAQNNSINALRASVSRLTKERNNVNTATTEGRKRFNELTSTIKSQTDQLKSLEGAAGDFRRNVGNYTEGVKTAFRETQIFGTSISQLEGLFKAARAQILLTTSSTKALRAALVATGIGAIVLALVGLVEAFRSTQRGADFFAKTLAPLAEIFESLIGFAQDLGTTLFEVLTESEGVIEIVSRRFAGFAQILEGIVELDFGKVQDGIAKTAEETEKFFSSAVERGNQIASIQIEIEKLETRLNFQRSIAANRESELQLIARDTNATIEERANALAEIRRLNQAIADTEGAILDQRIKLTEVQQQANDTSRQGEKELNDLRAQRIDLDTRVNTKARELLEIERSIAAEQATRFARRDEAEVGRIERLESQIEAEKEILQDGFNFEASIAAQRDAINKNSADLNAKFTAAEIKLEEKKKAAQIDTITAVSGALQTFGALAGEQSAAGKAIAIATSTIDTFVAINKTLASLPYPANLIASIGIGVQGFANVASIAGTPIGAAAAGGGTFYTRGKTMMMVGDNPGGVEKVTVTPISGRGKTTVNPKSGLIKAAGGATVISSPANTASSNFQNSTRQFERFSRSAMDLAKRPMQVAVTDINRVQGEVSVRETRARN